MDAWDNNLNKKTATIKNLEYKNECLKRECQRYIDIIVQERIKKAKVDRGTQTIKKKTVVKKQPIDSLFSQSLDAVKIDARDFVFGTKCESSIDQLINILREHSV
jgi:hypothetical protein